MFRKFTILFLTLTLCWTTVACGGPEETTPQARNVNAPAATPTRLSDGDYQVQQATYDDATGAYNLFLLNSTPPTFSTPKIQMAQLTDEQIKAGQKSYLKVENGQPVLYLTPDFKIEYVHAVTEAQTNPQTGQQENVVVRRENSFWTPFAGAVAGNLAGQAIGSMLFRPQYYVPPVYQPGMSGLRGHGGYGSSYGQAVDRYQTRYNAPPLAVRNSRTNLRTTGGIRTPSSSATRTTPRVNTGSRATGSGFGSSTLRQSGRSGSVRRPSSGSFGSGRSSGSRSRSGSFGSRRR